MLTKNTETRSHGEDLAIKSASGQESQRHFSFMILPFELSPCLRASVFCKELWLRLMAAFCVSASLRFIGLVLVAIFPTPSILAAEPDVAASLAKIRAVGEKGEGNRPAQEAWQALAKLPASQLPEVLAGMDGANPIAANYVRALAESIAERELKAGGKLPADQLEAFALNTKHESRGRRLAFELLTRVDATAPDRIIPKMLDDPSLELRRDAVSRRIDAAKAKLEAGDKDAAAEEYRIAFTAARDIDQIRSVVSALGKLEQKVDIPRHFGFVTKWKLIGPFDNTNQSAFDKAYPPETEFNPAAKYPGKNGGVAWIDHETKDAYGMVDLTKALDKHKGAVAYAATEFESAEARPVDIRVGCITANKVWFNGEFLGGRDVYHTGMDVDQYVYRGKLKAGKNLILVKVLQNEQTDSWAQIWQFQLRVCDAIGTAVLPTDVAGK
jgi:hypothetical protein